jgi:hypothetical protein
MAPTNGATMLESKAWSYLGRFVLSFAQIENQANQLFLELIGGKAWGSTGGVGSAAGLLLTYSLDLRKKLDLIEDILKSRGVDESKMFKQLHKLHDLRNIIVHNPFDEETDSSLRCDYINKYGGTSFAKKLKTSGDDSITYAEFDFYDAVAREVYDKLYKLWESAIPVTEDELRYAIEEAINSSDNVVRFPEKPDLDDED